MTHCPLCDSHGVETSIEALPPAENLTEFISDDGEKPLEAQQAYECPTEDCIVEHYTEHGVAEVDHDDSFEDFIETVRDARRDT